MRPYTRFDNNSPTQGGLYIIYITPVDVGPNKHWHNAVGTTKRYTFKAVHQGTVSAEWSNELPARLAGYSPNSPGGYGKLPSLYQLYHYPTCTNDHRPIFSSYGQKWSTASPNPIIVDLEDIPQFAGKSTFVVGSNPHGWQHTVHAATDGDQQSNLRKEDHVLIYTATAIAPDGVKHNINTPVCASRTGPYRCDISSTLWLKFGSTDYDYWYASNDATRTFSGVPTAADAGEYTITVTVTDNAFERRSSQLQFTLTVIDPDAPEEDGVEGDSDEDVVVGQYTEQHDPEEPDNYDTLKVETSISRLDAGKDFTGKRGDTIDITGDYTQLDEAETTLSFQWSISNASHNELLGLSKNITNGATLTPTFEIPTRKDMTDEGALDNGQWIDFRLTVEESNGAIVTDDVRMTIQGSLWLDENEESEDENEGTARGQTVQVITPEEPDNYDTHKVSGEDDNSEPGPENNEDTSGPQGEVEEPEPEPEIADCITDIEVPRVLDDELWNNSDCSAHHKSNRRARYFEFTLSERSVVAINLTSDADAVLFLSKGSTQNQWGSVPLADMNHRVNTRRNNGKLVYEGNSFRGTLLPETYMAEFVLNDPFGNQSFDATISVSDAPDPIASIGNAHVDEGAASLSFAVTLDGPAGGAESIDWNTSDNTARDGEDYTSASGTLYFGVGETQKVIVVSVLDDDVDEGDESMYVTLSNPVGLALGRKKATGTIKNSDVIPQAWLVRFGRATADSAIDAITQRFENPRNNHAVFAGFDLRSSRDAIDYDDLDPLIASTDMADRDIAWGGAYNPVQSPLLNSSFSQTLGETNRLTFWGNSQYSSFGGLDNHVSVDGKATSCLLGGDFRVDKWLAGVAASWTTGKGHFNGALQGGDMSATLLSVNPYLHYQATDRLSVWTVLGYGAGELELQTGDSDHTWKTDIETHSAAIGAKGTLLAVNGLVVDGKVDARLSGVKSDAASELFGNLNGSDGDTSRIRLLVETSKDFVLDEYRSLNPSFEVGLRYDGGDAETGYGVEVGGALSYVDAVMGLSVQSSARLLTAHEDKAYREWGASLAVTYDPGIMGHGLTISLAPSFGNTTSKAHQLMSMDGQQHYGDENGSGRLSAGVAWNMELVKNRGMLSPYTQFEISEYGQHNSIGLQWNHRSSSLSLTGNRYKSGDTSDHGLLMELQSTVW